VNSVDNWLSFYEWFAYGAGAMNDMLPDTVISDQPYVPGHPGYTNYHFVTGGLVAPEPFQGGGCPGSPYEDAIGNLQEATLIAETSWTNPDPSYEYSSAGVPATYLAVGSHPYSYTPTDMPNIENSGAPVSRGTCNNLGNLVGNWTYYYFPGLRHIATETNYSSQPDGPPLDPQQGTNWEGAYMMDVFTYMYDYLGGDGQWGYPGGEAAYPFNLMWYEGYDASGLTLGSLARWFYSGSWVSSDKSVNFPLYCPLEPNMITDLTWMFALLRQEGGGGFPGGGARCY